MTPFESIFGNPAVRHAVVALSVVVLFTTLAAVAWLRLRCAVACRPLPRAGRHKVEQRAWDFCPICGRPRPANATEPSSDPTTAPIGDAITQAGTSTPHTHLLPSALLRMGWTRQAALDAEGRIVTPCYSSATAYSIWGAGNRAFDPDGETSREWIKHLTDILAERHGGMSMQRWNRDAGRTHAEVVSVAEEVERRMGLGPRSLSE